MARGIWQGKERSGRGAWEREHGYQTMESELGRKALRLKDALQHETRQHIYPWHGRTLADFPITDSTPSLTPPTLVSALVSTAPSRSSSRAVVRTYRESTLSSSTVPTASTCTFPRVVGSKELTVSLLSLSFSLPDIIELQLISISISISLSRYVVTRCQAPSSARLSLTSSSRPTPSPSPSLLLLPLLHLLRDRDRRKTFANLPILSPPFPKFTYLGFMGSKFQRGLEVVPGCSG